MNHAALGSPSGRLPFGLLGALVLIVGGELSLGRFARHADPISSDWRRTAKAATEDEAVHAAILCFGDSQNKLGIQPRVIEGRLHQSAYNLSMVAGPAPPCYFLLRRVLKAGGRPRVIIVDHLPALLKNSLYLNLDHWTDLLTFPEARELARESRDPNIPAHFILRRLLRSFKSREPIRSLVLATFRGHSSQGPQPSMILRRNMRFNRGALLRSAPIAASQPVVLERKPTYFEYPFSDALNAVYIRKFLDLAAEREIPVLWLLPPCRSDWQAHRDHHGLDKQYERVLRSLQREYPGLSIVDGRHSGYSERCLDETHLDRRGATVLSADLADVLAPILAGHALESRWVKLPNYRPLPEGVELEDLEQSRIALDLQNQRRR